MHTKHTVLASLLLTAMLGCASTAATPPAAENASTTAQAKEGWYHNLVDFEYMKQQVEIPPKPGVVIVDARPTTRKYDIGHIPGAINVPDTKFDQMKERLPDDKNTLIIFYCEGEKCMLSHQAAFKTEKLGYTNIKVYPAGFPEWAAKGMPVSVSAPYIKKLIDEKAKVVLIDARPSRVFAKGSIPTAINVPDTQFDQNVDKLPADKAAHIIVFCGGLKCVLSDKVADRLVKMGYTNVMTYPEGEPEWTQLYGNTASSAVPAAPAAAAAPAAKPAAAAIEAGKEKGTITAASFTKIMNENPDSILVVDVRDAKEFKSGAIKGSINIPINELEKKMDNLPKGKPIVFVCGTGGRSGEAYDSVKLLRSDLDPWFIDTEVTFNADGTFVVKAK